MRRLLTLTLFLAILFPVNASAQSDSIIKSFFESEVVWYSYEWTTGDFAPITRIHSSSDSIEDPNEVLGNLSCLETELTNPNVHIYPTKSNLGYSDSEILQIGDSMKPFINEIGMIDTVIPLHIDTFIEVYKEINDSDLTRIRTHRYFAPDPDGHWYIELHLSNSNNDTLNLWCSNLWQPFDIPYKVYFNNSFQYETSNHLITMCIDTALNGEFNYFQHERKVFLENVILMTKWWKVD